MRQGSCVLIFGLVDGEVKVLASERKDGSGVGLPGGHPEPSERALDAAVRELFEETGLVLPPTSLYHLYTGTEVPGYVTNCFYYPETMDPAPELQPQPGEPQARWVTWDELFEGPFGEFYKVILTLLRS